MTRQRSFYPVLPSSTPGEPPTPMRVPRVRAVARAVILSFPPCPHPAQLGPTVHAMIRRNLDPATQAAKQRAREALMARTTILGDTDGPD